MPDSSMEEIIASISRIIAEENRPPHPARTPPGGKSGILELTEMIEADGSVRKLAGAASGIEPLREPPPAAGAARIEPAAPDVDPGAGARTDRPRETILSAAASGAAVAAFGQLAKVSRERRAELELPRGAGGRTLEEIVRDALHPLLRAWLDEHLPDIVERLVREEIGRVVREAGLR
jgi:uncharacterized protein